MLSDYDKKDIAEAYYEDGFEEGMEKGMEKGEIKRSNEIALAMLAKDLDPGLVAECTGLSVEEVDALRG